MTVTETHRPHPGRFLAGLGLGLIIGALAAGSGTAWYLTRQVWLDAGAQWMTLPDHKPTGPLPQVFIVPGKAWDYGGTTQALSRTVTEKPAILRVRLGAVTGSAGVSLDRPDGSALVSKERPITATDSGRALYFRITGREGPISLLVRNYNAEGQVGSVTVNDVDYMPEAGLSKAQRNQINRAGVVEAP